jgi:hypothetical protein
MLRQQVLKLYRSLLRAIRGIDDDESKNEVLQWVRTDFRNNKHHTDEVSSNHTQMTCILGTNIK